MGSRMKRGRRRARGPEIELSRLARRALKALGAGDAAVSVSLVSSSELRAIKSRFLGEKQRYVDVLAFPEPEKFPHPETERRPLGEVLLNETVYRKKPEKALFLLGHGILHLLGYRHETKRDMIDMKKAEWALMKTLGKAVPRTLL